MSYRELSMIDVKEFLRRWAAGQSNRKIARDTGTDRGTVSRYVAVAEQLALSRDREPTEDEVHEVAGIRMISRVLNGVPGKDLKGMADEFKNDKLDEAMAAFTRGLAIDQFSDLLGGHGRSLSRGRGRCW